jgi:hypothetical protein
MIILLEHHRKLGYSSGKRLPRISPSDARLLSSHSVILTFRRKDIDLLRATHKIVKVRKVTAMTRFSEIDAIRGVQNITLHGIEADSPLSSIIVWEIAHMIPVGGVIRFTGNINSHHQLDKEYFRGAFNRHDTMGAQITEYIKLKELPAERSNLDAWTFGIPVGPDDATLLNACVKRILELDVPHKEILLCGRPGSNFLYWDRVRIVGEDITAPPVQIAKKKNRLAQEATHPNLCILHDRVFLPHNFMEAVRKFGNAYPFTTFQSIWFDDKWNLIPRRYSDFNTMQKGTALTIKGLARDSAARTSLCAPSTLPLVEQYGFFYANPHRSSPFDYATGSLYLCKKDVWLLCPQDESLAWTEFEDVEHGMRAASLGIPSRINPYAITQSMISRPILTWFGYVIVEKMNGTIKPRRALTSILPAPRKPLIKKTLDQAMRDLVLFAGKYAPGIRPDALVAGLGSNRIRIATLAYIMSNVCLPMRKNVIVQFLKDYEKLIIGDQVAYQWHEDMRDKILQNGSAALNNIYRDSSELLNQMVLRPGTSVFAESLLDFLPKRGLMNKLGSLISAFLLTFEQNRTFVLSAGIIKRYRMITGSTPYRDFAD